MTFPTDMNLPPASAGDAMARDATQDEPPWLQALAEAYQKDEQASQSDEVTRLQRLIQQRLQDDPTE